MYDVCILTVGGYFSFTACLMLEDRELREENGYNVLMVTTHA